MRSKFRKEYHRGSLTLNKRLNAKSQSTKCRPSCSRQKFIWCANSSHCLYPDWHYRTFRSSTLKL